MTTITATKAREKLYQLLDLSAESHQPIQITGKRNNAVLISQDDWLAVQETLHLVSIPGMKASIIAGGKTPIKKCAKRLNW